jgi:4-amino-4-deoxy-L-arabinose transferase-like glycosyltransferase
MMQSNRSYTWLLLTAVLLNGLLWSIASPLWQGADERAHYAAIQFIGESLRLPDSEDIYMSDEAVASEHLIEYQRAVFKPDQRQDFSATSTGPNEEKIRALPVELRTSFESQETSTAMTLPPLYHLFAVVAYRLVYNDHIMARGFAVRLTSVCFAVLAAWACICASREIFPEDSLMQQTLSLIFSFHPMFSFLGSVINPEILLILEITLLTYIGARIVRHGLNGWRAGALGLVLAAGMMTRPQIWAMGLPLLYIFLIVIFRQKVRAARPILIMVVATAAAAGWWLIRSYEVNQSMFSRDFSDPRISLGQVPRPDYLPWQYVTEYGGQLWGWLFDTYWGAFGHTLTQFPGSWYDVLRVVVVVACIGIGRHLIGHLRNRRWGRQDMVFGFLGLCIIAVPVALGASGYWAMRQGISEHFQPAKGRYFIGPLVSQMAFLALGITAILPGRIKPWGHILLRLFFVLLNVGSLLLVVIPRYYF